MEKFFIWYSYDISELSTLLVDSFHFGVDM